MENWERFSTSDLQIDGTPERGTFSKNFSHQLFKVQSVRERIRVYAQVMQIVVRYYESNLYAFWSEIYRGVTIDDTYSFATNIS